jgi:hypothetical protein
MRKEFRGKRGGQGPDGYLAGFVEEDRRLVFSVFTRPEIFQEATVEAGSNQEGIWADGMKKGV